jgi:hypothetical protein
MMTLRLDDFTFIFKYKMDGFIYFLGMPSLSSYRHFSFSFNR